MRRCGNAARLRAFRRLHVCTRNHNLTVRATRAARIRDRVVEDVRLSCGSRRADRRTGEAIPQRHTRRSPLRAAGSVQGGR